MSIYLRNFLRFCLIILLQVLILNKITLRWWLAPSGFPIFIPYVYPLFILLLPFETPNALLFLLAFVLGLTIDAFYDTPGLHAAACVLLAMVRVIFINITVQKEGFDNEPEPTLSIMGFRWFIVYVLVLTLFHHFFLFNLEVFNLSDIQFTLSRVVLSTLFTVFLILISGLLFYRRKERK